MTALVTNFGMTRHFPSCLGNVFIASGQTVEIKDERAAEEIGRFSEVKVERIKTKSPRAARPKPSAADYAKYPINLLRSIAAKRGVRRVVGMKKTTLIAALEAASK